MINLISEKKDIPEGKFSKKFEVINSKEY